MRLQTFVPAVALVAFVAHATAALIAQPPARERAFAIEPLATPARVDSLAPQLRTAEGRTFLSWIARAGEHPALRFVERTATGWSEPRLVATGHHLMVNTADVPSVTAVGGGRLAAHWLEDNGGDHESYDLRVAWSSDAGKTWSAGVTPHHDGTRTQHGFASILPAAGGFGLVWLDGRSTAATGGKPAGSMALRATSFGPDGRQGAETVVDGRVCECCPIATAASADGVIVAFRDRSDTGIRDIAVARLAAGKWSAPAAVHADGWTIEACPVNGPAIDARAREVAVAWFTMQQGQGRAFVAFSSDGGRRFGPPHRVDDTSSLGRVQLALLPDGGAAVAWIEYEDGRSQLRVRRIDRGGGRGPAATLADGLGSQHPRMVRHGDELLFAWAESSRGSTRIRTARAALPR